MRWDRGHQSNDVEDRRAEGASGGGFQGAGLGGGAIQLLFFLFRRFGIVGVLVGGAALYFLGGLSSSGSQLSGAASGAQGADLAAEKPEVEFVSWTFDDIQRNWAERFARTDNPYRKTRLVLFRGSTRSGCGVGQAEMGPFYCPADERVYIDLSFYEELKAKFGAPGDFAQAYVIAHEVGHHLQKLLGTSERVSRAPESQQTGDNGLSVRLELQADCYAGMWGKSLEKEQRLEDGDIAEALKAAQVIGDDALQKQATGSVRPESFTHGTSAQRMRWFKRGFEAGDDLAACDTFGVDKP
jgi:predicted metalloprotease